MMSVSLANTDLLWAALLLVLNGTISLAFGLRLELNLAMVVHAGAGCRHRLRP